MIVREWGGKVKLSILCKLNPRSSSAIYQIKLIGFVLVVGLILWVNTAIRTL